MYDLITIGNVVMDLYFKGKSLSTKDGHLNLSIGGKYPVDYFHESVGGSAANVAIGASNQGLSTAVLAKVGENSFKQIILQKLLKKMVSTEFLLVDSAYMNISSILLSESGEKTIVHYATPHETLEVPEAMKKNMLNAKAIYMGSLPGISLAERIKLLTYFADAQKKIMLAVGALEIEMGLEKLAPLLECAHILILNGHEYADLVKKDKEKIDFNVDCAKALGFEKRILIITDGPHGSYVYYGGNVHHQPAMKADIVDTTGAGDAFCAGFIAAYLKERSIDDSMNAASAYACKIIERVGAN